MTCSYEKILTAHMVTRYKAVPRGELLPTGRSPRWLDVNSHTSLWLDGYENTAWSLSIQLAGHAWRDITSMECKYIAMTLKLVTDPEQISLFDLELELLDQD